MIGTDLELLLLGSVAELATALAAVEDAETASLTTELVHRVEEGKRPFLERLGAARALALLGDPRIDPLRPRMVPVAAGPFQMGMDPNDADRVGREFDLPREWLLKACPRHNVQLDDFEIGRFPVTQLEWAEFVAATGFEPLPTGWSSARPPRGRENHPVHGVGFDAALAFCAWLSGEVGLRYRLPTEPEWERAARGSRDAAYPWGDAFDPRAANTREAGIGETTPVGLFPAGRSSAGAFDMAGNVEELTGTLYRLYPGAALEDPEEGTYPVSRGGCYALDADLARCDRRHGPGFGGVVGFRLARSRPGGLASEAGGAEA